MLGRSRVGIESHKHIFVLKPNPSLSNVGSSELFLRQSVENNETNRGFVINSYPVLASVVMSFDNFFSSHRSREE